MTIEMKMDQRYEQGRKKGGMRVNRTGTKN